MGYVVQLAITVIAGATLAVRDHCPYSLSDQRRNQILHYLDVECPRGTRILRGTHRRVIHRNNNELSPTTTGLPQQDRLVVPQSPAAANTYPCD